MASVYGRVLCRYYVASVYGRVLCRYYVASVYVASVYGLSISVCVRGGGAPAIGRPVKVL